MIERLRRLLGRPECDGTQLPKAVPQRLRPGDRDYRAFVGPPEDYDVHSGRIAGLLFALGLRDEHYVLDLGCGSLRAGRMLIPYLRPERYTGIEPERWLVDEGIDKELGNSIRDVKSPRFVFDADFGVDRMGRTFDFVIAQSIFSHTQAELLASVLRRMPAALDDEGILVATYVEGAPSTDGSDWIYPGCVAYSWGEIREACEAARLECALVDWPHPRQRWFVAGKRGSGVVERGRSIQSPIADLASRDYRERLDPVTWRRLSRDEIAGGAHRSLVGHWDEMGRLELELLVGNGLEPGHRVLDVGCGPLRAGVRLVEHLDAGGYVGTDRNPTLLDAGAFELSSRGLFDKDPLLVFDTAFAFPGVIHDSIDYALAIDLFPRLTYDEIELCLVGAARVLKEGGRLYASWYPILAPHPTFRHDWGDGLVTHRDRTPRHLHIDTLRHLCRDLPLEFWPLGSWSHPEHQHLCMFVKRFPK